MARASSIPTLTLLDEIEKCEKEIVETLLRLPDGKPIRVIINSGGGSVYASLGIATLIRMKKFKAEAVVLADCSSSALVVFASCQKRLVAPHASFLFHPMRWGSEDQTRLSAAESWSAEFGRVSRVFEDWMVEGLGLDRRTLRRWVRDERYIEAGELIDRGVAEPLDLSEDGVIPILPRGRKKARTRQTGSKTARIRKVG